MSWFGYLYFGGMSAAVPIVSLTLSAQDAGTLALSQPTPAFDFIGTPQFTALDEDAELNVQC